MGINISEPGAFEEAEKLGVIGDEKVNRGMSIGEKVTKSDFD